MRVLIALAALLSVGIIAAGVTSGQPSTTTTPRPAAGQVYSPDMLARASTMTQQMSVNAPISGHEYHGHTNDEQLRLSSDLEFTRELEVYQQQIDKMLARTPS